MASDFTQWAIFLVLLFFLKIFSICTNSTHTCVKVHQNFVGVCFLFPYGFRGSNSVQLSKCLFSLSHLLVPGGLFCFVGVYYNKTFIIKFITLITFKFTVQWYWYSCVVQLLLVSFPWVLLLVHTDCIPVEPVLPLLILVTVLLSMISPRNLLVDLCFIIS